MKKNNNVLVGYTSQETAYKVEDYPYGFRLRTSIHYWIESKDKFGDRFCSYTINPKTGRRNKPNFGQYVTFQYMYLNDEGHVKTGHIDSYDKEVFQARFYFILAQVGEEFLSEVQKKNIRVNHYQHVYVAAPYQIVKYSEERKDDYKKWLRETLTHIKTCEFKDLVEYPERPEEDNPEGEVKMIVREHKEPEPPPSHSITVDKLTGILKSVLPGFNIEVSEYTIFGTYFKMMVSVKDRIQAVSLSLNVKTLELQVQQYGGNGGQSLYRDINPEDPREKYLAMGRIKIPFRRPACNEKDVLSTIERFFSNYKRAMIENMAILKHRNEINLPALLGQSQPA